MKTIVICSGGLDSVTLAYQIAKDHTLSKLISFDYGQRHRREITYAAQCAQNLDVPHDILDISAVGAALTGSALTDNVDVPDGHYAENTMKQTIVPNRNAIMLTIGYGVAAAETADAVATAVHAGDHFIYPDCRPAFVKAFESMQNQALEGFAKIKLLTPFLTLTKADIVSHGDGLGVPFGQTWSCYKGGDVHCGRCGTCVERQEAFNLADVADPTQYADSNFWQQSVQDAKQRGVG